MTAAAAAGWPAARADPLSTIPAAAAATTTGAATAAARAAAACAGPGPVSRHCSGSPASRRGSRRRAAPGTPARPAWKTGLALPPAGISLRRHAEPVARACTATARSGPWTFGRPCARRHSADRTPAWTSCGGAGGSRVRDQAGLRGQRRAGLLDGGRAPTATRPGCCGCRCRPGRRRSAPDRRRTGMPCWRMHCAAACSAAARAARRAAGSAWPAAWLRLGTAGRAGGRAAAAGQQQRAGQAGDDVAVSHLNLPDRPGPVVRTGR